MSEMDEKIREVLNREAEKIEPDEWMFLGIHNRIQEKERNDMKKTTVSRKMKGIAVVAMLCIVSGTCYAASKIDSYVGFSSRQEQINTFPSEKQIKKLVGFQPKFVEDFSNGFQFQNASPGTVEAHDAEGGVVESGKDISFSYENKNRTGSFLSLNATALQGEPEVYKETLSLGEIEAGYENVKYKFVPGENGESYITQEDRKLEAEGKLYISYGSAEVQEEFAQSISWKEDGIKYTLLEMGYEIPKEEFVEMAKEIINQ